MKIRRATVVTVAVTAIVTLALQGVLVAVWRHYDAEWFKWHRRNEVFGEMSREAAQRGDYKESGFWLGKVNDAGYHDWEYSPEEWEIKKLINKAGEINAINPQPSEEELLVAAGNGSVGAMFDLARLYSGGMGAGVDLEKARRYAEMAAQKGNVDGMLLTAILYDL